MRQLPTEITWIYLDGPPCKIQPNHASPRPIRVLMKTTRVESLEDKGLYTSFRVQTLVVTLDRFINKTSIVQFLKKIARITSYSYVDQGELGMIDRFRLIPSHFRNKFI